MLWFLFLLIFLFSHFCNEIVSDNSLHKADLIIFSFNRPMQLFALLESVNKHVSNLNSIYILYRVDAPYENAYQELKTLFPQIFFVKQGSNPRTDFKQLLLQCVSCSTSDYILFAVDDDIVKDYIDICECINAMEKFNGSGFYLRSGTNTNRQYTHPKIFKQPPFTEVAKEIVRFRFIEGKNDCPCDWTTPYTLDMAIFKKSTIEILLKNLPYWSPNSLEGALNILNDNVDLNQFGLCFKTSKIFSLPLNMVQQDGWCPHENSHSPAELLKWWNDGFKIDIKPFFQVNNNCAHMGYRPQFIRRD